MFPLLISALSAYTAWNPFTKATRRNSNPLMMKITSYEEGGVTSTAIIAIKRFNTRRL